MYECTEQYTHTTEAKGCVSCKLKFHASERSSDSSIHYLTISAGMKTVDFLDVTLDLSTGKHQPYRKPNNKPVYVHQLSNHPPAIIQQLPKTISRRLTDISNDRHIFEESAPAYNGALRESGYVERVEYM